ncbi:hypothetical protein JL722_5895 [Aureococcus anophagefferens]|nr:hypothetical protein JL722_5895 [Aureococcus anophagefferens]
MTSVFNNLRLAGGVGSLSVGEEIKWFNKQEGKSKKVKAAEVSRASWSTFGKHGCATLFGAGGSELLKLDGFARRDQEALGVSLKDQGVALSDVEFCSSGVNRGKHSFEDGQRLVVHQTAPGEGKEPKRLFDIDLSKVSQCVLPAGVGKQAGEQKEVTMQFDDKAAADDHQLVELRLYIPPGSRSYAEDEEEDDDDAGEAARVHAKIMEYSKLTSVTGTQLAQFGAEDGAFLLPRGRYAVEMYGDFFRMHGNMYDYKINFADVERFILLPRTDDVHYAFIIALDKPIRQGQQRYGHLVWQLKKGDKAITVNLSEAELSERYGAGSGLKPELAGPLYQLVARVFKVLSGKKVFTTGKFRSNDDRHAVNCSVKASTGQLYPLERSLVFVHKPTLVLRFEDVASVEFERFSGYGQGSATKNFDLKVSMRSVGGDPPKDHSFTSIERAERRPRATNAAKEALGIGSGGDDDDSGPGGARRLNDEDSPDEDYEDAGAPASDDDDDDDDDDGDGDGSDGDEAPKIAKKPKKEAAAEPKPKKRKAEPKKEKAEPKKKRKKKDPNAPKGKSSAYIMFGNAKRAEVKEQHPDFSLGDIGRELGKRWKELTDDDKKPYVDLATADAERYDREMAAYKAKQQAEGAGGDDDSDDE